MGIAEKLKIVTLPQLMQATNIFGRGFAVKRFQIILDEEPTILTTTISNDEKIERVKHVNGMAEKSARKFVEFLPAFNDWIHEAGLQDKLIPETVDIADTSHPLYGKKYVITGFRDAELSDKLKKYGAKETSVVTKKTDFVIVKDKNAKSTKMERAVKLGVAIVTPDELE